MKIAILGAGKMGVWFTRFFQEEGHSVVLADRNEKKLEKLKKELAVQTADFVEAVQKADWILISVSINAFENVAKTIGPHIIKGQIIMDICSVKEEPVKIMHKHIEKGLILGTHPVFGPGSSGLKNKAFILTPTTRQEKEFAKDFKIWLEAKKARVFVITPHKHDELMSVVLGFPHFAGLVACDTLLEMKDYPQTKDLAGTTYRMLFTLAEATAIENPELFSNLQFSLPEMEKIEKLFIEKANDWLNLIKQKDSEAITAKMGDLKAKLARTSPSYKKSYETMYKMLAAAEK